jgi:hypothetical protein
MISQLHEEIIGAGLPEPSHINGSGFEGPGAYATKVDIGYETPLTIPERDVLHGVVTSHIPAGPMVVRPLHSILPDVQALTDEQFTNVWNDLSAPSEEEGAPHKYLTDYGVNAGPIFTMDWSLVNGGLTGQELKSAQHTITTFYVQDNPKYLVNPPFDPSINIPGAWQTLNSNYLKLRAI